MAKAKNPAAEAAIAEANKKAAQAAAERGAVTSTDNAGQDAAGDQADNTEAPQGKKELNPSIPSDKEIATKAKADQKAKDDAAKAEAKVKREQEAAAKKAQKDAEKAAKAEAKAKARADREARLAELGKNYKGSMLALADKVKTGIYVKGLNGQLRSENPLAVLLDGISPTDVITIGLDLLKLEENPYAKLNVGQQSMNLRNRMRGALKKETLTEAEITDYIKRNNIHQTSAAEVEAAAKARAEAKQKRENEAAAKKAQAAAKAEPAPANEAEAQAAA